MGRAQRRAPSSVEQPFVKCVRDALAEQPVPPLAELSRRLGYPHTGVLWRHHSDLCRQLKASRQRDVMKRRAHMERVATAALKEVPVPSLRAVCRRLNITVRYMSVHLSSLAQSIVAEHRRSVLAETANRRALLLRRIPDVAAELHKQGLYPPIERILERLGERSRRDWKTICVAVREAHNALDIPGVGKGCWDHSNHASMSRNAACTLPGENPCHRRRRSRMHG